MIAIGLILTLIYNDQNQRIERMSSVQVLRKKKEKNQMNTIFLFIYRRVMNLGNTEDNIYHKFSKIKNVH